MATSNRDNHEKRPATDGSAPAVRRRRQRRPRWQEVLIKVGKVLGTFLLIGLTTGLIMACFAAVYVQTAIIPNANLDLGTISMDLSSTMYYTDRETGERTVYLTVNGGQNRVLVDYEKIPENLVNAAVCTEDKRFYSHHGVDWIRTARSAISMFTGGSIQGGSTITQQLIKNVTQYDDVTVKRKITEIFSALEFDKNYTKEETLEWYLNYIYLGEGCYGVYTASYMYFGKNVSDLTLAECASLIGITNNPSIYDPYLSGTDKNGNFDPEWGKKNNAKRAGTMLFNMVDQGKITEEEYNAALEEVKTLDFKRGKDEKVPTVVYTWYQDQVIKDVINDLMEKYGWSETVATNKLFNGGLIIDICMDKKAQDIVDEVFANLDNLPYVSGSGQQMQAGMTVIDATTGNVAALAGGMGPKTGSRLRSLATDSLRQPGSSIKPLSVYGPALEMGLITPYSVLDDVPYRMEGGNPWPVNAHGYYTGRMTVNKAVEISSNPMAVRTLGDLVTPQASFEFMRDKFGFTSLVDEMWIGNQKFSDINLAPLALGGLTHGVSTDEMAAAYSAFPRMGKYIQPRTYTKVTDNKGKVLLEHEEESRFILKESTAYYMNSMLKNVVAQGTGGTARLNGMTVAGKTGTTSDTKDRYFVGYTPYYTAAVWCGYKQPEPMGNSGNPPAVLWKKVMQPLHQGLANQDFPKPTDVELVTASYCMDSGMVPTDACKADPRGRIATGVFAKGDEPQEPCTAHALVEVCSASPFKNDKGEGTGLFHLVSEFCPEVDKKSIGMLVVERNWLGGTFSARDDAFFKVKLTDMGPAGICDVHTSHLNLEFDPNLPETWPRDDPDFDINDPATWPGASETTDPTLPPESSDNPTEPTLPPNPTPVVTPDGNLDYVPANNRH
ncbi:MAG: transglycosylase domain-containing protein [Oscillospiraceae bacterium]